MNIQLRSGDRIGWNPVLGVLLVLIGLVAIIVPFFAGIAVGLFFGWLILLAGAAHLVYAWSERGTAHVLWQVLIGVAYLAAALYIILHPLGGLIALSLVMASYIMLEGIIELALFALLRGLPGSLFLLSDGIISFLLAGLIFFHWPSSSFWALGTFVGISMVMSGLARLRLYVGRRNSLLTA